MGARLCVEEPVVRPAWRHGQRRRHAAARQARVQAPLSARAAPTSRSPSAADRRPCRPIASTISSPGPRTSRPTRRLPRRPCEFLADIIRRNPGQITLVAVGPLQNIGDLVRLHPDVVPLVKRVVLMSGSIGAERTRARRRWPSGTCASRSRRRRRSMPRLAADDRAARRDDLRAARRPGARDAAQGGHAAGHRARGAAAALDRPADQPHDAARSAGARRSAASRPILRPLRRRCRSVSTTRATRASIRTSGRPVTVCLEPKRDEFMRALPGAARREVIVRTSGHRRATPRRVAVPTRLPRARIDVR